MPRIYKRKLGSRKYKDYEEETLLKAIEDCKKPGMSIAEVAKIYKIPHRTLRNKVGGQHSKSHGGQCALPSVLEDVLVKHLSTCADYGMPLEWRDIKSLVKGILEMENIVIKKFTDNTPGDDWVRGFLSRHEDLITQRTCQNIKRQRAALSHDDINVYFEHLRKSLEGVSAENILNYDETNLTDDPGQKKCIFRRGIKHPERAINFSKGNITVMFAGSAAGEFLPPYVIYKSEHLWHSWCEGGPPGTRYGRSKSGWMDSVNFEEWFLTIAVPWARRKLGRKVVIGDNLSSHISHLVLKKCEEHNIGFILLPPNSTDKCQPLDVSFFAPLKREWRRLLESHKVKHPSSTSLDKKIFPAMLGSLIDGMGMRCAQNLMSGFRACGIHPLDPHQV
ncbi:uncharacterized protein LOC129928629 [Biomphalaria glabrata]|uniref:Uncharacterized protein LOC129928629 n=1 Tax=Biomphalaria glabrata TaxID=6526 RepID=A0A9W3BJ90_BIOGL|nr:uncharacterized protein LOC129928629 [Biomphalaria glabrata]